MARLWIYGRYRVLSMPWLAIYLANGMSRTRALKVDGLVPLREDDGCYDFAVDVRELVCEELRPGVMAEWSDPRERVGVR